MGVGHARCSFFGILLIKNVLILAHSFSFGYTKLLALLVPAPFVDLGLGQIRLLRNFC